MELVLLYLMSFLVYAGFGAMAVIPIASIGNFTFSAEEIATLIVFWPLVLLFMLFRGTIALVSRWIK